MPSAPTRIAASGLPAKARPPTSTAMFRLRDRPRMAVMRPARPGRPCAALQESTVALLAHMRKVLPDAVKDAIGLGPADGPAPDLAALDAGADDYITKPFSTQELLARIRAVLRRRAPEQSSDVVAIGELQVDGATHRVTYQGQVLKLGPTEFKLLNYLMHHAERVHSRSQLLDKVWGDHVFIEERTVDVHVKRLRDALSSVQSAHLVETVRGAGYRISEQAHAASA